MGVRQWTARLLVSAGKLSPPLGSRTPPLSPHSDTYSIAAQTGTASVAAAFPHSPPHVCFRHSAALLYYDMAAGTRSPRTPDATNVIHEARRTPRNGGAVLLKAFWVPDKKMFAVNGLCAAALWRAHHPRTHRLGVHQSDRLGAPSMPPELLVRRRRLSNYVQRPCNLRHNIPPLLKFHAFRSASPARVADSIMTIYVPENSDRHDSKPPRMTATLMQPRRVGNRQGF